MTPLECLTRKGGPIDAARTAAAATGARPYRVFLCWSAYASGEVGKGPEKGPVRYEIVPRPKVLGYAALTRNPTNIGVVPAGVVRVEEVPLWLHFEELDGRRHPDRQHPSGGPELGVKFWYEIELDGRDPTHGAQAFRLSSPPDRDEERAQWILSLERTPTRDR